MFRTIVRNTIGYQWIGKQRYAELREILKLKTDPDALDLYQKTKRRVPDTAKHNSKMWINPLPRGLYLWLIKSGEPVVLNLDISYANVELRHLILHLGSLAAAPLALVLVVDSEITELSGEDWTVLQQAVLPWTRQQVGRFCHRRNLFFDDPEAITLLHQWSDGLPEIVQKIVSAHQLQSLTPSEQSQWIRTHKNYAAESALRFLVKQLDDRLLDLFALDGLIEANGLPRLKSSGNAPGSTPQEYRSLHHPLARKLLRDLFAQEEPVDPDNAVESLLQRYEAEINDVPETERGVKALVLQQRQDTDNLRAWNRSIASYLDEQRVWDPLLIARYWLNAGEVDMARQRLNPLLDNPTEAFGTSCNDPLALFAQLHDHIPVGEGAPYAALAGDLASASCSAKQQKLPRARNLMIHCRELRPTAPIRMGYATWSTISPGKRSQPLPTAGGCGWTRFRIPIALPVPGYGSLIACGRLAGIPRPMSLLARLSVSCRPLLTLQLYSCSDA